MNYQKRVKMEKERQEQRWRRSELKERQHGYNQGYEKES